MAVILRTNAIIGGSVMTSPGLSTLWWTPGTAGGSTADATDCLARFRTFWDAIKAHIAGSIVITFDPVCVAIEATTGVLQGAFTGTTPLSVSGTNATDPLPRQTQGLIRWGTNSVIGGRRLRGRLFLPGPCEGDNTSGAVPLGTYVSDVNAATAPLLVAGATTSIATVWHRPSGAGAGASSLITSASCSPTWSVLRSRRG